MKRALLTFLMLAVAVALAPVGGAQGIWYEDGRVHVDVDFTVHDFGDCLGWPVADSWIPGADTACYFYVSWNPSAAGGDLCDQPQECAEDGFQQTSFCHFKILDADGNCLYFNSRPWVSPSEAGTYDLIFSIPKEQVVENGIYLGAGSDFGGVEYSGYYQEPGFKLEEGQSYILQVTEQAEGCRTVVNSKDGERVTHQQLITIPVCCKGMRGDVDGSGRLDIADVDYLIDYLYRGGPRPSCFKEADVNGDESMDLLDVNYLIDYFWKGGPRPLDCPQEPVRGSS